jgi:hypothetical protein
MSYRYPVGQAVINGETVFIALLLYPSVRNRNKDDYPGYIFNVSKPTISLIHKNIGLPYKNYSEFKHSTDPSSLPFFCFVPLPLSELPKCLIRKVLPFNERLCQYFRNMCQNVHERVSL